MVVGHLGQHGRRVDAVSAAEGDQEPARARQPHQPRDVIGDQHVVAVRGHQIVPRRARPVVSRQHRFVGVQLGLVGAVGDCAEHHAFGGGRLREHQQRLVGMGGDDRRVEQAGSAAADGDQHAFGHRAAPNAPAAGGHLVESHRRSPRRSCADPPVTVRQVGEPNTDSMPWWSRKTKR